MTDFRTIATVRKSNTQEIRVGVSVQGGCTLIDTRVFATARDSRGEPHPTKAGICVAKAKLPELIEALQAAEREVSE